MSAALRYEWVRMRTLASTYWMGGLAVLLTVVLATIMAATVSASSFSELDLAELTTWVVTAGGSAAFTPVLASAFVAVVGATTIGHEYRYGTNKATLAAVPDRVAVLVAKMLVLLGWVLVVTVATLLLNALVAATLMDNANFGAESLRPSLGYVAYCAGFGLAGFGLAAIFRNQTGAIVAVLVWPYIIEPIVFTLLRALGRASATNWEAIANLLPASAGRRTMFDPYEIFADFDGATGTWGLGASAVVFWVGVLAVVVCGSVLFVKRDA